jgi:hypothetical protein
MPSCTTLRDCSTGAGVWLEAPRAAARAAAPSRASPHSCSFCPSCHLSSRLRTILTTFAPLGNFPAGAQKMHLKNISICWCTAFDSGSALQARRVSANAELKRLIAVVKVLVPHLRRSGANLLIGRELGDGRQRRRISAERRRSLGGRFGSVPSAESCPGGNRGGSLGTWRPQWYHRPERLT